MAPQQQQSQPARGAPQQQQLDDPAYMNDLERQISDLERSLWKCDEDPSLSSVRSVTEGMCRARTGVEMSDCERTSIWKWVPPVNAHPAMILNPLSPEAAEGRRLREGILRSAQVCRCVLMENRASSDQRGDCSDPTDSRFYVAVVRHDAHVESNKLARAVQSLRSPRDALPPDALDFHAASDDDVHRITGFDFDTVTPFAMENPNVPVILDRDIALLEESNNRSPKFLWVGGGHVDLKLGMELEEFVRGTDAIVADISLPMNEGGNFDY